MGGTPEYMWRDEARLTPWMAYQFDRLNADLQRLFGVRLYGSSGIRTRTDQEYLFKLRYTTHPGNRRVYDTRWWNGQKWYRIDPLGTVAVPGTSNHEIQGETGAIDIRDTGADAGIASRTSARGRWFRAHCHEYGMENEGDSFGEGWHFRMRGIWRTPPTAPAGTISKPATPAEKKRKKTMSVGVIYTNQGPANDKDRRGAIVDYEAGTFDPFGWFSASYANMVAKGFGLEAAAPVTSGHYDQIRQTIADKNKRDGKLSILVSDGDAPKIKE